MDPEDRDDHEDHDNIELSEGLFQLPQLYLNIQTGTSSERLSALRELRQLSGEGEEAIDQLVEIGFVPLLVALLDSHDEKGVAVKLLSVRALVNIAARGTHRQCGQIVDDGAVPKLVQLMSSSSNGDEIRRYSIILLANIAGDCSSYRDFVLEQGVLQPLLSILNSSAESSLVLCAAIFLFSNLWLLQPVPSRSLHPDVLDTLFGFLRSHKDDYLVLGDALGAFMSLLQAHGTRFSHQASGAGMFPLLVELFLQFFRRHNVELHSSIIQILLELLYLDPESCVGLVISAIRQFSFDFRTQMMTSISELACALIDVMKRIHSVNHLHYESVLRELVQVHVMNYSSEGGAMAQRDLALYLMDELYCI